MKMQSMAIWKLALLEDNPDLLQDRILDLEKMDDVMVVAHATNSSDFLKQVAQTNPDAILLDIELRNDSMNGLDIAYKLNLPVLFVSSENAKHIKQLEHLKLEQDLVVDHITKPFTSKDFTKSVTRFLKDLKIAQPKLFKYKSKDTYRSVEFDSIVFLMSDKMEGSESNNKMIHFKNSPPDKLIDFSFSKMEDLGFDKSQFIKIHRSFRVNKNKIIRFDFSKSIVVVKYHSKNGKQEEIELEISENYRSAVREILKNTL
jgi:DNA-binding LytR/AlgR family response regulator